MSSTFFRPSCAVFWFCWLMTLSYVFGMTVYENKYIVLTDDYIYASNLVKLICLILSGMAFVGCVFVKCDISHICCFLLYIVPLMFLVPALCILGIIGMKSLNSLSGEDMVKLVQKAWDANDSSQKYPTWSAQAELEYGCCGVFSWKDYPLDIFSARNPINGQIVPSTCCKTLPPPDSHCTSESDLIYFLVNKNETNQTDYEAERDESVYKSRSSDPSFPYLNDSFRDLIHTRGCNESLLDKRKAVEESHVTFLIILLVSSILMAIIYIQSCCSSLHDDGTRSTHSLDVRKLSFVQVQRVKPALDLKLKDISKRSVSVYPRPSNAV